MRERAFVILVAVLIGCAIGGGAIVLMSRSGPPDPTIEDHPASYWAKCLTSEDEAVREHAKKVLPQFGTDGVWPSMKLLGDGTAQDNVVDVLVAIGHPAVAPLIEALRSNATHTRVGAIRALDRMPKSQVAAASSKVAALLDDDATGPFATQFLCNHGADVASVAIATQVAESASPQRQADALRVIGHATYYDSHLVALLERKCSETDDHVHMAAFEALCGLTPPAVEAAPLMIDRLTQRDSRAAARIGLARMGTAAIEPLRACTTRPSVETRVEAVNLLANSINVRAANEAILEFVNDVEPAVAGAAEASLASLHKNDLQFVKQQLKSPHPKVRAWAIHELRKIQPPLIDEIAPLLDDREEHVRNEAADAIRSLWQADDPMILESPKAKEVDERVRGIRLLPFFRDTRKYDMMLAAMEDAQPAVRLEAVRALGRSITSRRAVDRLIDALKNDPMSEIRVEAATSLAAARSSEGVESALQSAAHDADTKVAATARESLQRRYTD